MEEDVKDIKIEEQKQKQNVSEIDRQMQFIQYAARATGYIGVILFIILLLIQKFWLGIAALLFLSLSFYLFGVYIVQTQERVIIEFLGKFSKTLSPGPAWRIPGIETIRAIIKTWKQPVYLWEDSGRIKIDFKDDSVEAITPLAYVRIGKEDPEKPEKAIYYVDDWYEWTKYNLESILGRYLNSLYLNDALDEGMARGNLIKRIEEAPEKTDNEITLIRELIDAKEKVGEKDSVYDSLIQQKHQLENFSGDSRKALEELTDFLTEAKKDANITCENAMIPDIILNEKTEEARRKVLIEKRNAEAAVFEAAREAAMRVDPIRITVEKLKKAGFSNKRATETAVSLEVLETLAKEKSLFLTDLNPKGIMGIEKLLAGAAAIFNEVKERRKGESQ